MSFPDAAVRVSARGATDYYADADSSGREHGRNVGDASKRFPGAKVLNRMCRDDRRITALRLRNARHPIRIVAISSPSIMRGKIEGTTRPLESLGNLAQPWCEQR